VSAAKGKALAAQRLLSSDFARVYKRGRRARGALLGVVVLENELGRTRMGLSVSKRHARRAVDRNKVRRLFREAFRLERERLPAGLDLVLIAGDPGRPPALEALRAELVQLTLRAQAKKPRAAGGEPT
jgi:ribonuclease P protein component